MTTMMKIWTRQPWHWLKGRRRSLCQSSCRRRSSTSAYNDILQVHPKVSSALNREHAVVALESTIVTHGMPYPHNLRTAQEVEEIVARSGVTPATVAAIEGRLCVGLTEEQLTGLALDPAIKTSRRDLAWVLGQRLKGGTTVSATMIAAHLAGIPIFVTGGIGGVHRGGETSLDISADLVELGRTPVTVVSAGIKSILDIPRTLEYLETQGVTVATFGEATEFPAFFSRHSGVKSPINVRTAEEAAELIATNLSLGLGSGILIAVPIPEEHAADGEMIEQAIQEALAAASEQGTVGKDVTPFILRRVNDLTRGKSVEANVALVKSNAKVGSRVALELATIRRKKKKSPRSSHSPHSSDAPGERHQSGLEALRDDHQHHRRPRVHSGRPVVIGASVVDYSAAASGDLECGGTTNPGRFEVSYGGVGRNLADAMTRFGENPIFLSAVGTDFAGEALQKKCSHMDFSHVSVRDDKRTAAYCPLINKEGEVVLGISDMEINDAITPEYIGQHESALADAPLVCMDGNIPADSITLVSSMCAEHKVPLWFEPTCVRKATKVCRTESWKSLTYASPNVNELRKMYAAIEGEETVTFRDDASFTDKLKECLQLSRVLLRHIYCLVITLGRDGILVCRNAEPEEEFVKDSQGLQEVKIDAMFSALHYPSCPIEDGEGSIVSVSGAGDCLAAAIIVGILRGHSPDACIKSGLLAAERSLHSYHTVPASVTAELASPGFALERLPQEPSRLQ